MSNTSVFGQALQAIRVHRREMRNFNGSLVPVPRDHRELFAGWQIEINQKNVGVTVSRSRFNAVLWNRRTNTREYLSGFASQQAALEAVHVKIREINNSQQSVVATHKVCGVLRRK